MQHSQFQRERWIERSLIVLTLLLAAMSLAALWKSWNWPLIGDEGILHYVVFLLGKGLAPYATIKDVNLPGSYLLDAFVIHCLGPGDRGERIYDLLLCVLGCSAAMYFAWPKKIETVCALCGGLLFLLIHLQDGLAEAGQRDFAMAVFAMCACAIFMQAQHSLRSRLFLFYLVTGFILIIKPTLLTLILFPFLFEKDRSVWRKSFLSSFAFGAAGLCVFPAMVAVWLHSHSALRSFHEVVVMMGGLHNALPRRPISYLLVHASSPLNELLIVWAVVIVVCKQEWTSKRIALLFFAVSGLLSFLVQGKGLSYHRYPFLFFILILMSLDFANVMQRQDWRRYIGITAFALYTAVFAPICVWRVMQFDRETPFENALAQQLSVAGSIAPGAVQCLDTYVGCHNVLYRLQQVQSTGYLYDCYLTLPASGLRDRYRREFMDALVQSRPQTIVVTDQPCFASHQGFQWINDWAPLSEFIDTNYTLNEEWSDARPIRHWSRLETPPAFRIYVRRANAARP